MAMRMVWVGINIDSYLFRRSKMNRITSSARRGKFLVFSVSFIVSVLVSACVQNPVTGEKDFLLVDEGWELQVGAQQYLPLRQQQGGDYTADPKVELSVIGNCPMSSMLSMTPRPMPGRYQVARSVSIAGCSWN